MPERDQLEVDVLFVGAGPASLGGAIRLGQFAQQSGRALEILVIEKAAEVGNHGLSGAVMDPRALDELLPNWRESALESIAIGMVWLIVYGMTRQILRRFRFLENLFTMCAWCRKLQRGEEWVSLEDYCARELGVDITHGICPQCGRNLLGPQNPVETR